MTQPDPKPNQNVPVWELVVEDLKREMPLNPSFKSVMADMLARDQVGRERYKTPLQAFNGRDALQDAYEEALDQTVYLRQAIVEGDADATLDITFKLRLENIYWNTLDNCLALRSLLGLQNKVLDSQGKTE